MRKYNVGWSCTILVWAHTLTEVWDSQVFLAKSKVYVHVCHHYLYSYYGLVPAWKEP